VAKLKHTKNELKKQKEALRSYERYLPTLRLKKQELQMELLQLEVKIEQAAAEEQKFKDSLAEWIQLLSEDWELPDFVAVENVALQVGNIAGVRIPLVKEVVFKETPPDLHMTPVWIDAGVDALKDIVRLHVERKILEEQSGLLNEELETTSQQLNLFEKVKIPEATQNIRVIRVFLDDMLTAEIGRAKMAKNKLRKKESAS